MGSFLVALSLVVFVVEFVASQSDCKCIPGASCWPSDSDWDAFNSSLSGALIRGVPPGSVCYPDQPNYDQSLCQVALSEWDNSTWHASNPISVDYTIWVNNSCNAIYPNGTSVNGDPGAGARGCTIGNYPVYAVAATNSDQISTALEWASEKNIRVVIKTTGHNYPGRSTGFGSLSIWTHNLQAVEYLDNFQPASCPTDSSFQAMRISAGSTGSDVQSVALSNGVAIVSGGNPDTGVIGWFTGGGHGFLSTSYGMGADNLLEVDVVTPNGTLLTANPCQNSDLFFAARGGGGGTYGVIYSAVVKAFPTPQTTHHLYNITSANPNASAEFWNLMGFIHTQFPRLKEGGMQGYYTIAGPPYFPVQGFEWTFFLYNKPNGTVEALMKPIYDYVSNRSDIFTPGEQILHYPSYQAAYANIPNEPVGESTGAYGSRLLSNDSVTDLQRITEVLAKIGPEFAPANVYANPLLLGHFAASPNTPSYYPDVISMTPAWRGTISHLIVKTEWAETADEATIAATYQDISTNKVQALRDLSPDTGAYFNECDSYEPDWQTSFFGPNYPRLAAIKQKYDPDGVLWCNKCVGSEDWAVAESGALCRT